ncbi:MAG: hypothetical protein DPW18_18445 [Chloroflexi bacterium]|nr:hypothetical protein [Chloroflexota bacterium]
MPHADQGKDQQAAEVKAMHPTPDHIEKRFGVNITFRAEAIGADFFGIGQGADAAVRFAHERDHAVDRIAGRENIRRPLCVDLPEQQSGNLLRSLPQVLKRQACEAFAVLHKAQSKLARLGLHIQMLRHPQQRIAGLDERHSIRTVAAPQRNAQVAADWDEAIERLIGLPQPWRHHHQTNERRRHKARCTLPDIQPKQAP